MILPLYDTYCIYYSKCNKKSLAKLDSLFNRAIRIINMMPRRTNVERVVRDLGLMNLSDRRFLFTMLYAFERTLCESNLDVRDLGTRLHVPERKQLKIIDTRVSFIRKMFIYKSINYWNLAHTDLHKCASKREVKNYILKNFDEVKRICRVGVG